MESYKHLLGKLLLADWIRETVKYTYTMNKDYVSWLGIEFRPNRHEPSYGVYTEYPMAMLGKDEFQLYELWDEKVDDPNYNWKITPPSYQELTDWGYKINCIFDIALAHKGGVRHAIEVVNTSDVNSRKMEFCDKYNIEVHTINCDEILSQCSPIICNEKGEIHG